MAQAEKIHIKKKKCTKKYEKEMQANIGYSCAAAKLMLCYRLATVPVDYQRRK